MISPDDLNDLAKHEKQTRAQMPDAERREMEKLEKSVRKDAASIQDQVGRGYNPTGKASDVTKKGRMRRLGNAFKNLSARRKWAVATAAGGGITAIAAGLLGLFGILNVFQLDHLLNNIEAKGFVRYQVDMEGRSDRWISAYLMLRLGEVEDPNLKPADRDNILFRANTTDLSNPMFAWYKAMRGGRFSPLNDYVTQFEQDLLEKENIKFASIACRGTIVGNECRPGGNVVRFRTAIISIRDEQIKFPLSAGEIDAIERGDINGLNNRLRQFIDVEIINTDHEAKKRLKAAIKANTKYYQVIKRYYLRKAIQNMTGIRDWRFWTTKKLPCVYSPTQLQTRQECLELRRSIRNKIIAKTFPESMTGGKFIQCLFGLTSCKNTTDPSDPESKSSLAPLPEDCGTSANPQCETSALGEDGKGAKKDTNATDGLKEGVGGGTDEGTTNSITKKITLKILTKLNGPLSVVSIIDQLNIIDKNIKNGSISSMVYMARATQAIGVFTTFGIMRDQLRTGEAQTEEVNVAMEMISNAGNSEGWQNVVASGDSAIVEAASMETTNSRKKYCSAEFQEKMLLPENEEVARSQYHWLCDGEKVGGDNLAKDIENGWNNSVGVILTPILALYNASGLSTVMGWFNSALDAIFEKTVAPIMQGILSATGLGDKIEDLMAWMTSKVASILGAGPAISENAPAGVWANHMLMGAAAASEFAARNQGAALTSSTTAKETEQRVAAFEREQRGSMSTYDKYLSLANPKSPAAQGLFAITNNGVQRTFMATLSSLFSGSIFAQRTNAATGSAYAAAKFTGLETYDFPGTCSSSKVPDSVAKLKIENLDANDTRRNYFPYYMTPLSSTNADDLGLIPIEEINWELLGNADRFYERLYRDENADSEKIKKVWNCRLLDSSVSGGLGAAQNPKTLDENAYGFGFGAGGLTTGGAVGDIPTGTAKELAQRILDHPNIDFQVKPEQEEAMRHIAQTGHGRNCGAPAVSPALLGVILAAAEKYKIVIGVLVDGYDCNGGFHPKGMAVDINGVNPISGSGGTGNRIAWSPSEMGILKKFYDDVGPLLSQVGGGGLGQKACFTGPKPEPVQGVTYFNDTCHHIHMDVGKR